MLMVSIRKLVEAVVDAGAYELPEMSDGTEYLYNNVYQRLSHGEDMKLSAIDFDAFDYDDVDCIRDLHFNVLESDSYKAGSIASTLHDLSPVSGIDSFV